MRIKEENRRPGTIYIWWEKELSDQDRARYLDEFRRAREKDTLLQALYPDDCAMPVAWLVNRRAGVRFESF